MKSKIVYTDKEAIDTLLKDVALRYSQSKATTNAGRILRIIASIIPTNLIVQIFAHKLSSK